MTFDIPHMIATGIIVLIASSIVEYTGPFKNMTKGKRILWLFLMIFVLLTALNIIWPYGATA